MPGDYGGPVDLLLAHIVFEILRFHPGSVAAGYARDYKELHPRATYVLVEPGRFTQKWFALGGRLMRHDYEGAIYIIGGDRATILRVADLADRAVRALMDPPLRYDSSVEPLEVLSMFEGYAALARLSHPVGHGWATTPEGETWYVAGCLDDGRCVVVYGDRFTPLLAEPLGGRDLERTSRFYPGYELRWRASFLVGIV